MTNTGTPDLRAALALAEAALSDIGDADREPGDDLAWCEARAAKDLPTIRAALAAPAQAVLPNPYANMGSMEEAWRKGYEGGRAIAAPGSEYMRVFKAGEAARAAVQAVPAPGVPSDATIAVHEACGKIIKTLAAIVNSPQSDDQFDREVLQRDPVMAKVMEVKSQVDAIYKAVPLPIHPYMQRQKAAAGAPAAPALAGEPGLDDSELEDLVHAANQEALGYGVSIDVFMRLAKTVRQRAARGAAQAAPVASHPLLDAARAAQGGA